ncbi:tRNA lysidine(34) synthetase TilS [Marinobacter zhejiangensis]|uniref:tRNA(Ile)-lysidine synthase n=1 Tax=Marinobacter zhejiangensis TaxID=488535 RepID=A0A1I4RAC0_9GAMM|nr:tRNA lysidine(34) synthetase TilS [Marinobacter zhejiangensis]SFM49149.1 tRNA(Ile)-lysidine synthase [Marinobacter zhejiangensis]
MTQGGKRRPDDLSWPEALTEPVQALRAEPSLLVALSGGLDSIVLLHTVLHCLSGTQVRLRAVHINHQLQANAGDTEAFCRQLCQQLGVELVVERVAVSATDGPAAGLEAGARAARYEVFERLLASGGTLLMAHHQDDQAETVLFRLVRGSGFGGLAGIPARRRLGKGWLVRPFLAVPRCELKQWAETSGLAWVDDPSNQDQRFDRNFLRHAVMPLLKGRWPNLLVRIGRTSEGCREGAELAQTLAQLRFDQLSGDAGELSLDGFKSLSLAEQKNLLRWWIAQSGFAVPERGDWAQVVSELVNAGADREPELAGAGFAIRRFQSALYLVDERTPPRGGISTLVPEQPLRWGGYRITLVRCAGADTQIPRIQVGARQGGERLRAHPEGVSKPLKKWLQEKAVPPWERARLPLMSLDGELIGVGLIWLSPRFQGALPESGWRILVEREFD